MNNSWKISNTNALTNSNDDDFIQKVKNSIELLTSQTNIIMGIKDLKSIYLHCSPEFAKIVGLKKHQDVIGRRDHDMPCDGTVEFADQYVQEDLLLINNSNTHASIKTLNVHNYSDGLNAILFNKITLTNPISEKILGTMYSGIRVSTSNYLNIIPNYHKIFGKFNSISTNENNSQLNDYEREICYLLILNWDFTQIAQLMDELHPLSKPRTQDAIRKKRDYICAKLGLPNKLTITLVDYLISIGFHNNMPKSFFNRIIGSTIIERNI